MIRNFKKLYAVLSIILVFISVFLSGCNIIEKLFINDLMPKREVKKNNLDKSNKANPPKDFKSNQEIENKENKGEDKSEIINKEKYNVTLFFANKEATDFVLEERRISKVTGLAKETILELIKGPNNLKAVSALPKGTKLLDVKIKEGICYVNFSNELQKNHQGGSAGEYMTVYSIVKTLNQFSSVNKVQILIEGKVVPTLAGHLDISKPLENINR